MLFRSAEVACAVFPNVVCVKAPGFGDRRKEMLQDIATLTGVRRFMDGKYKPNGKGGLFTIPSCERDLRTVEIWYQMNWYLNSIIYEKGC